MIPLTPAQRWEVRKLLRLATAISRLDRETPVPVLERLADALTFQKIMVLRVLGW